MAISVCFIAACILILAASGFTQSTSDPVPDLNKTAVTEIENGDLIHAVQLLEQAVRRDPTNGKAFYNLGTAYFLLKELGKAHSAFVKALDLQPDSAAVLNQLGVTQMVQGDYEGASRNFRSALAKRPDDPVLLYNLGCLLIRTKDFRLAIDILERAQKIDSTNAEILFNLAFAYGRNGDISKAVDKARATLGLSPDDLDARKMLIVLYLLNKERTEALKEVHNMEGMGSRIDPWLSKLLFGKRIVSVDDLRQK